MSNSDTEKENVASPDEQQRKDFESAFESAETLQERLNLFKKMEESELFQESKLGHYSLQLSFQLQKEGNNTEKLLSLSFGERALQSFISRDNSVKIQCGVHFHHWNYAIAQVLNLLGSSCLDLKRYNESLRYFERADTILCELDKEGNDACPGNCILSKMETNQLGLYKVKSVMGKKGEAAMNMRTVLEIREKTLEEGCMKLGKTYKSVYKAYVADIDFKQALPFCLKALEIYKKHMGSDFTVEVGKIMSDLGHIYAELREHEKALEQTQLALSVMKKVAPDSHDLLNVEFLNGCSLRDVGRYEEAFEVYKGVASHVEVKESGKANAFCGMAKASFSMGRFDDAKMYMRTAQRIYEKEEMDPLYAAFAFEDMSRLYEKMNDNKTAISLVRRVLAIPKIPQKLILEASARLFMLTSLVGKEDEAIPYLEDAMEKVKSAVRFEHYGVGFCYKMMGAAYMKSGQPELALKYLTSAKDIMDVYHGPNHLESLETSHNLALTYRFMKRFEPAIEIEEAVVEGLKGLVPSDQEFLDEAVTLLNDMYEMKEMMSGPAWPLINAFANLMR